MKSQIDWNNFKIRCSSISKIMSNSRNNPCITDKQLERLRELQDKQQTEKGCTERQKEEIAELLVKQENSTRFYPSDGCIEALMEHYAWEAEGMIAVDKEAMDIDYTRKGKEVEGDSIEVLSIVDRVAYLKNDIRVYNDYFSGEPDLFVGEHIMAATKITDIKSIWDYPTFLRKLHETCENGYDYQLKGYGDITGAQELELSRVLVSMPEEIIDDYKYKLAKKMNSITIESPDFLRQWLKWERSMRFDDIPHHKRVFKLKTEPFTQEERQKVYDRVKNCREWLWKFDEQYQKLNKVA